MPPSSGTHSFEEDMAPCRYPPERRRIHVLRWRARNAERRPPVVCVHGLTRRAEDFIRLGEALCANRDVYAFSMAGRGKSDRLHPEQYIYPQYVADCQFLIKYYELGQVDWVGTSLGGIVAFMIAGAEGLDSSPIRRLVLNDIGPFVTASALRALAVRVTGYDGTPFRTRRDAEAYCHFAWEAFGITDPEEWKEFIDFNLTPCKEGFLLHFDARILDPMRRPEAITDANLWSFYCRMTCPTLVLHGESSKILTSDLMAEMSTLGPKPDFVTFPGCGHAPALFDPRQIDKVVQFLNEP
jgi:pimeloyl-ACP methyl ester carboxylesterase